MSFPSIVQFDQDVSRLFDYDDTSTLGDSMRSFGNKNYEDIIDINRRRPKITRQNASSDDLDEMKLTLSRAGAGHKVASVTCQRRYPRRKRKGNVTKTLEEALACLDGSRDDSPISKISPVASSRRWSEKADGDNINYECRSSRNAESRRIRTSGSSLLPQTPKRQVSSDRLELPRERNATFSPPRAEQYKRSSIRQEQPGLLEYISKQSNKKISSYAMPRKPPQRQASRTVYMQRARRT